MQERRGARVATTFAVTIEGLETQPVPRRGDISQSGAYFETSVDVGAAGTIHWLQLVSPDGARRVRVMAYVVRTVASGGMRGAAFEFMPESDEAVASLQGFVKYALGLRSGAGVEPHIAPRLAAKATPPHGVASNARGAVVGRLSVRSMVLETSWAVAPGESLRVDIAAPGMTRRIRLEGTAVRVAPTPRRPDSSEDSSLEPRTYTIEVEVREETDRPLTHSSMSFAKVTPPESPRPVAPGPSPHRDDAIVDEALHTLDDLLSSLISPPSDEVRRRRAHHLSGQLSSVPLTTLVALFEMERMTGELVVRHDIEEARLYIESGRIVDLEPLAANERGRDRIRVVLGWKEGTFEFDVQPVGRTDRIEMSTTALLIDLAREDDEGDRARNA